MRKIILAALALAWFAASAYPQNFSAENLARRTFERRAVEAVIWAMPAVSYELMLQQLLTKAKGEVDQIVYWLRPLDWKNQTLTPNPDAIYLMAFFNTKEVGPVVIRGAARQRRLACGQYRRYLADAARGCRSRGVRTKERAAST